MDSFDMGPHDSDAHQRIERLEKRLASLVIASQPKGCVCPPRSEETCQNPFCGRKPPLPAHQYGQHSVTARKPGTPWWTENGVSRA